MLFYLGKQHFNDELREQWDMLRGVMALIFNLSILILKLRL